MSADKAHHALQASMALPEVKLPQTGEVGDTGAEGAAVTQEGAAGPKPRPDSSADTGRATTQGNVLSHACPVGHSSVSASHAMTVKWQAPCSVYNLPCFVYMFMSLSRKWPQSE